MRCFLPSLLFLSFTMTLHADTYLYVSMAPEEQIQIYRLNPRDGSLTPIQSVEVEGSPGALAVDPAKKFLFASLRTGSKLASFAIDPATGKLKHLGTAALGKGEPATFVATDRTGRWLITASYQAGKVLVHELDAGKIKTTAVETVKTAVTAHACVTDPDNRWVFVPHVTPNAIFQFRFDAKTGALKDAGKAAGGKAKAGPRHFAWHPVINLGFSSDEEGNSITAYRFDDADGLKPVQTLSTLPKDFKGKNTTAEVKVHPNGKFVWVSNRGHDSLAGFAIDGKNGKLTSIGQTPTEKTPRSFEIDPDGRFVFGAGEGSGKLAVYSVDADKGTLTRIRTVDVGKSVPWVMAVKISAN